MKVHEINKIDDGSIVTLESVKIVNVKVTRAVTTGVVQDITIGDDSGTIVLSVWDNKVDHFQESEMYKFQNLLVWSFRNQKMLTLGHFSSFEEVTSTVGIKWDGIDWELPEPWMKQFKH